MAKGKYLKIGEVAERIGVAAVTVKYYCNQGKIKYTLTPGKQRIFKEEWVQEFLGETLDKPQKLPVFYSRSSSGDKSIIDSQVEKLHKLYGEPVSVIRDKGSGLNENRAGLRKLKIMAAEGRVTDIYMTSKDRLTRFGFTYLQDYFKAYKVELHYIDEGEHKDPEQELVDDFMALLASFSGRYNGLRSAKNRKVVKEYVERLDESH